MDQDAERQIVQKYYQRAVAGARSDVEELEIARQLLEGALKGQVPDDKGTALYTIADVDLPVDAEFLLEEEAPRQRLRRALPAVALVAIGLILVFLAYGGGSSGKDPAPTPDTTSVPVALATQTLTPLPHSLGSQGTRPSATTLPTETSRPTETPTVTPTPLPTMTATPAPPREVEVKPEPVELEPGAVIPVSIEIAGRYFPVVPTTLRDDPSQGSGQATWAYVPEPDQVSWLAGSRVNVVLGLPYDDENQDLLGSTLAISDTITLRDSVGAAQVYQVVDRCLVSVYETETLRQHRVGLTLVLLGGNEESPDRRLVIQARPVEGKEVASARE